MSSLLLRMYSLHLEKHLNVLVLRSACSLFCTNLTASRPGLPDEI